MSIPLNAADRLAAIKADEDNKKLDDLKSTTNNLLSEWQFWSTKNPITEDFKTSNSSGLVDMSKRVFKIARSLKYDLTEVIAQIYLDALDKGYKVFGADTDFVPYVIIGYEDGDVNTVINRESLQLNMLDIFKLFQQVSARVTSEEDQAVVLFSAQALMILNSNVCNQLIILIPEEPASNFLARYQETITQAGCQLIKTFTTGYKILYPNSGNYSLPIQIDYADALKAVQLMREQQPI